MEKLNLSFDELRPEIIKKLNSIDNLHCPICWQRDMILMDWFVNRYINKKLNWDLIVGWPFIPTFWIICKNCWHVIEFSLWALWLLPKHDEEKE